MRRALLGVAEGDPVARGLALGPAEIARVRESHVLGFPNSQLQRLLRHAARDGLFASDADPENAKMEQLLNAYVDKAGAEAPFRKNDFRISDEAHRLGVGLYWLSRHRDYLRPFNDEAGS